MTQEQLDKATFAGGCFWCVVAPFEDLAGVRSVVAGYTGGEQASPTYEEVSSGRSGHVEAVQITFDPAQTSYAELLQVFWRQIDPTDTQGQFADQGSQYHTAIFYHSAEQKQLAEQSKQELERSKKFDRPIATRILAAKRFYPAEEYHQGYHRKNPGAYQRYRLLSGREPYLQRTWGGHEKKAEPTKYSKPDPKTLQQCLSPLSYNVTQKKGTEAAFNNPYWNNKQPGIYVDVVSGEPLFSSLDKFDSGTGWPSFTRPLEEKNIIQRSDSDLGMTRTEVRSRHADSHLGHVFDDGPQPTGQRYCINSASLRFIPAKDLEQEGYGQYAPLFKK